MLSRGIAYVEGARAPRALGSLVTLSWAVLLLAPVVIIPLFLRAGEIEVNAVAVGSWISLAYLRIVSMFLASALWYRGLALGGIARIGQINLLLPLTPLD